jgi:hypothetical protein
MASTFTPTPLVPGVLLTAGVTTYYTVPVGETLQINQLSVTNTDGLAHACYVYLCPTGALAGPSSLIWSGTLAPGQPFSVYQAIGAILGAGSTIQARSDASSVVSLQAGGVLFT